jgi:hypothetical protein
MSIVMSVARTAFCGLVATLLAGASSGCAVGISTPGSPAGNVPRPYVHFSTGAWTATGTILETRAVDARLGERIVRPWAFGKQCEHGACRTTFSRQTLYTYEQTTLSPHGRFYVAHFPAEIVPCPHRPGEDAGSNEDYATFTLWWSAEHQAVFATEKQNQVGRCGGGTERTSWIAKRTDPAAAVPAPGP